MTGDVAWQFNEAVSLLREARQQMPDGSNLADEIDEALPAIQSALVAAAQPGPAPIDPATLACDHCHAPWDDALCGIIHEPGCVELCPTCGGDDNGEGHQPACPRVDTCAQFGPPWVWIEDAHPEAEPFTTEAHRNHMRDVEHRFLGPGE